VQNRFVAESTSGTSFVAERVGWNTLPGPASAIQTRRPWPVFTSAVQIDHGRPLRWGKNAGGVFWAGTSTKAICAPSGENAGERSESRLGLNQMMVWSTKS